MPETQHETETVNHPSVLAFASSLLQMPTGVYTEFRDSTLEDMVDWAKERLNEEIDAEEDVAPKKARKKAKKAKAEKTPKKKPKAEKAPKKAKDDGEATTRSRMDKDHVRGLILEALKGEGDGLGIRSLTIALENYSDTQIRAVLSTLLEEGLVIAEGETRSRVYKLKGTKASKDAVKEPPKKKNPPKSAKDDEDEDDEEEDSNDGDDDSEDDEDSDDDDTDDEDEDDED